MARSKLFFDIFAKDMTRDGFESVETRVTRLENRLRAAGRNMQITGAALTAAVTTPLAIAARDMVSLFNEQDRAMAQVRQGVESTGGAAGFTADELARIAGELQAVSTFGDEQILNKVTSNLLTFPNVSGENFERAQESVLDLATALDRDLISITLQVGKALNDPVRGLSALSEAGTQFSNEQREVVTALTEAGDIAEAQAVILDELATQYGGRAAAAAETFSGHVEQLSNSWGDLKEEFGAIITEILPPLVELLERLVGFLGSLDDDTKTWVVAIGALSAALGPVVLTLGTFATIIAGLSAPVLAVVTAVAALTAGIIAFWPEIVAAKDAVVEFIQQGLERLKELPGEVLDALKGLPADMLQAGKDAVQGFVDGIWMNMTQVDYAAQELSRGAMRRTNKELGRNSPSREFMRIGEDIIKGMVLGISGAAPAVEGALSQVTDRLKADVSGMFKAVLIQGKSFRSALSNLLGNVAGRLFDSAFDNLFAGFAIPAFAGGTSFAPGGMALVGERGPELVSLPRGAQVYPAPATRSMLASPSPSVSMNVSIDARGADAAALTRVEREVGRLRADMPALVVDTLRKAGNRAMIDRVMR